MLCMPVLGIAQEPDTAQHAPPADSSWWPNREIDAALQYIRLRGSDLVLRDDYVERDACRLGLVDDVMQHPDSMPRVLERAAALAFGGAGSNGSTRVSLTEFGRLVSGTRSMTASGPSTGTAWSPNVAARWSGDWRSFLSLAAHALARQDWPDSILAGLNAQDRRFVVDDVKEFVIEDEADKDKSAELLDSLQRAEDQAAVRFAKLADRINWSWVYHNGIGLVAPVLAAIPTQPPPAANSVLTIDAPFGRVLIGTTGADLYTGSAALVIDPGGDDLYELTGLAPGENRLVLDYGGNDKYLSSEPFSISGAQFGWSVLADFAGDDLYQAGNFSLGCGWFGVGVHADLRGRDTYLGDICSQGAGGFGIGILADYGSGNDQYTAHLFSQGFGFAAGGGILADDGGNDLYFVGGKYEDVLRYRDHYLTLGQGFGYGIRPHFSGGVGLMLDRRGNDVYVADIFGQGCSYWWAFGGLYDGGGNDQYTAFQYAQGSATHLTAGCLLDESGDDRYESKGVSQGCGHDWAPGYLIDRAGNDRYSATDLSQAAGSANGVGVLIDIQGDDAYFVDSKINTQGYGNPRRDYGSIGLFLDLAGHDRYGGPGADSTIWLSSGRWGVGVDADSTWLQQITGTEKASKDE